LSEIWKKKLILGSSVLFFSPCFGRSVVKFDSLRHNRRCVFEILNL
jgi:hypothetical protein